MTISKSNASNLDKIASYYKGFQKFKSRDVIYGVTDRTHDPFLVKVNDYLIDHSSVSTKEKGMIFHSLRLLVNAGVRFTKAIEMLARQNKNQRLKRILQTIAYDMNNQGLHLSNALEKYPTVFTEYEVKMIQSGELTGKIEHSIGSIAAQLKKTLELENRVKTALMYPIVVFIGIIIASIIVLIGIIPRFSALFADFSAELPISTKILIGLSNFILDFWWLLIAICISGWQILKNWKHSEEGKKAWDRFILQLPLAATLVNNVQTLRIANNFSALVSAGIPINKSLKILSEIVPNVIIKNAIRSIETNVHDGMKIHESFSKEKDLDPILGEVIEIGEKSGNLVEVLQKISHQYELEVDHQLNNLTTLIEPIIILIVGVAIFLMAMAVMTPIFQLQQLYLG